jgi:hypothetical protein
MIVVDVHLHLRPLLLDLLWSLSRLPAAMLHADYRLLMDFVPQVLAGFSPGAGRCPPEHAGDPERYMKTVDEHGEYAFLEWPETLRENRL